VKRLLLAAFCLLLPVPALAVRRDCNLSGSCTAAAPCSWKLAANWTACNGKYPDNNDGSGDTYTASIGTGTVIIQDDGMSVGDAASSVDPINISTGGTLIFSPSRVTADVNGYKTFTIKGSTAGVAINGNGGDIFISAPNRIAVDTTGTGAAGAGISNTGKFVMKGNWVDTTAAAVSTAAAAGVVTSASITGQRGVPVVSTNCGSTVAMAYVLTLASGAELAKRGGRIRVTDDSEWADQQFEIVGAPGDSVTLSGSATTLTGNQILICTALADSSSDVTCNTGDTKTCGQRLNIHSTIGVSPSGDTTTPTARPANTAQWVTDPTGNAICTAANQPRVFCTASAAGTAVQIFPTVGMAFRVIEDPWIYQSAGTNGWRLNLNGNSVWPVIQAANFSGGGNVTNTTSAVQITQASPTTGNTDMNDINCHDMAAGSVCLALNGVQNTKVVGLACHDTPSITTGATSCFFALQNGSNPPTGIELWDSLGYATGSNFATWNNGGTTAVASTGVRVMHNLVMYGCSAGGDGTEECRAIECNGCQGGRIAYNQVHDFSTIGASPTTKEGDGIRMGGAAGAPCNVNQGLSVDHNWVGDIANNSIIVNTINGCAGSGAAATANYVSDSGAAAVHGIDAFGNVVRNSGLAKNSTRQGQPIRFFRNAKGNVFIGNDTAQGTTCASACSGGVKEAFDSSYMSDSPAITFSDNVIALINDGSYLYGAFGNLNGSQTISHVTQDGGGISFGSTMTDFNGWTPTADSPVSISDTLYTHSNNSQFVWCSSNAHALETISLYGRSTAPASFAGSNAEQVRTGVGFPGGGNCTSEGTAVNLLGTPRFKNRTGYDWNLLENSPALTGGSGGSALGIRAFRFDRDEINSRWGYALDFTHAAGDATGATVTAFPANISNGQSNIDTDGDGVMDFIDNCPYNWNPSQCDGDGDGVGRACDTSGDTCPCTLDEACP
jgi:hypothetical protein